MIMTIFIDQVGYYDYFDSRNSNKKSCYFNSINKFKGMKAEYDGEDELHQLPRNLYFIKEFKDYYCNFFY